MTYLSLEVVFGWVRITPVYITLKDDLDKYPTHLFTLGGFLLYFVQQKI